MIFEMLLKIVKVNLFILYIVPVFFLSQFVCNNKFFFILVKLFFKLVDNIIQVVV